jgi:hypothetical protein
MWERLDEWWGVRGWLVNGMDGVAGSIPAGGSTQKPQVRPGPAPGLLHSRRASNRHLPEICQKTLPVVAERRSVMADPGPPSMG